MSKNVQITAVTDPSSAKTGDVPAMTHAVPRPLERRPITKLVEHLAGAERPDRGELGGGQHVAVLVDQLEAVGEDAVVVDRLADRGQVVARAAVGQHDLAVTVEDHHRDLERVEQPCVGLPNRVGVHVRVGEAR